MLSIYERRPSGRSPLLVPRVWVGVRGVRLLLRQRDAGEMVTEARPWVAAVTMWGICSFTPTSTSWCWRPRIGSTHGSMERENVRSNQSGRGCRAVDVSPIRVKSYGIVLAILWAKCEQPLCTEIHHCETSSRREESRQGSHSERGVLAAVRQENHATQAWPVPSA
jgi:hypothetical protein